MKQFLELQLAQKLEIRLELLGLSIRQVVQIQSLEIESEILLVALDYPFLRVELKDLPLELLKAKRRKCVQRLAKYEKIRYRWYLPVGRNVRTESIVLIRPLQAAISAIKTVALLNIVGLRLTTTSASDASVGVGPGTKSAVGKLPGST